MGGLSKILVLLLLLTPAVSAGVEISEIMYNPTEDTDANLEWLELYNSGTETVNLQNFTIDGNDFEDVIIESNQYIIIARNKEKFQEYYNPDYHVLAGSFVLANTGDTIDFNGDLISYSPDDGGNGNGKSIELKDGNWQESSVTGGTPGEANSEVLIEENTDCDWKIDILLNDLIFIDDLDFSVALRKNYGEEQNLTVRGEIENLFGEVVKEYKPWTDYRVVNKATKKYSPNLREGTYKLHFWIDKLQCNDHDQSNNEISKLIAFNPLARNDQSTIEIDKLYLGSDDSAEWGDQFTVKVNIYKGDETKEAVYLWAEMDEEKVSKTTKVSLTDKYKNYPLTLPVQLEANCNGKISDGEAKLVLEAFGLDENEEFEIEGIDKEVCRQYKKTIVEKIVEVPVESKNVEKTNLLLDETNPLVQTKSSRQGEGMIVYESNSVKARSVVSYLMILSLSMLSFVLIYRK